jgi:amino acid transporter
VLTTYAATVFFGPDKFAEFPAYGDGNPWQQVARDVWGGGWILVFVAILISAIANSNAGANATTRTWYALGRNRILVGMLAKTHPRWQSPYVAVIVQFVLALVVALPLGYKYGPVTAFSLVATMVTAVIILIYITLNVACIGFYLRERRSEFNVLLHLIMPVLGVLAFIPAIMAALGIGQSLISFVTPLPYPLNLAGPVVAGWLGLGLLYLIFLYASGRGDRVRALNQLYVSEEGATFPSPRTPEQGATTSTPTSA